jgi:hypothetical protein
METAMLSLSHFLYPYLLHISLDIYLLHTSLDILAKVMEAEEGTMTGDDGSEEWEDIEDRADKESIPSDPELRLQPALTAD